MRISADARLKCAAAYVRKGAHFADIGCDHALLTLFLLDNCIIEDAICADIADGPIECAKKNIEKYGYTNIVKTVKTDGLSGLDKENITDVAILGMGGELIVSIIDRAPFLKDKRKRLILQPMSRASVLIDYLYKNGFEVMANTYAKAQGRLYRTLMVEYTGVCSFAPSYLSEVGSFLLTDKSENQKKLFLDFEKKRLVAYEKIVEGKKKSSIDFKDEQSIIDSIHKEMVRRENEGF